MKTLDKLFPRLENNSLPITFWLIPLFLSSLTGLFVIDAGFILDDRACIEMNPILKEDLSVTEAFRRDFRGTPLSEPDRVLVWRPLLPILWKYVWQLGNGSSLLFRLLTLSLHILATLLVLSVGRKLIRNKVILFMTGVLFSVHPIHSEALGSLVSQADILSAILGMFAIWLAVTPCRMLKSFFLAGLLGLACLAKETAVVFGLIIILIPLIQHDRSLKDRLILAFPALIVTIAIITFQVLIERGGRNPINNLAYCASGFERTLHGLYIIGRSISMCFLASGLSPSHDYAAVDLSLSTLLPYSVVGVFSLILCYAFFLRAVETHNITWIIGITLLLGPAFIQSSLVVCVNTELAERLLYTSSIASSAITAAFLFSFFKPPVFRWLGLTVLSIYFLIQSWYVEKKWQNDLTLFEYAIQVEPLSWRAHNNYGVCLTNRNQYKEAVWHYMVASYILSKRPDAVDPSPIMKLENLPVDQRIIEGPAFFNPDNPEEFIILFYQDLLVLFNLPNAVKILAPYYSQRYQIQ